MTHMWKNTPSSSSQDSNLQPTSYQCPSVIQDRSVNLVQDSEDDDDDSEDDKLPVKEVKPTQVKIHDSTAQTPHVQRVGNEKDGNARKLSSGMIKISLSLDSLVFYESDPLGHAATEAGHEKVI
uniref:Uncharacterized protein n=1 Tax=Timema genevievae TaxID=629358 RepID=A0A7R9JPK0_TIMGE|nr:unnamed protein product [Timema genevievae]